MNHRLIGMFDIILYVGASLYIGASFYIGLHFIWGPRFILWGLFSVACLSSSLGSDYVVLILYFRMCSAIGRGWLKLSCCGYITCACEGLSFLSLPLILDTTDNAFWALSVVHCVGLLRLLWACGLHSCLTLTLKAGGWLDLIIISIDNVNHVWWTSCSGALRYCIYNCIICNCWMGHDTNNLLFSLYIIIVCQSIRFLLCILLSILSVVFSRR